MSCFPFTTKELGNSVFPGMNRLHLPALEPVKTEPAMSLAELCTHCDWPKLLAMSSPLANNNKKMFIQNLEIGRAPISITI